MRVDGVHVLAHRYVYELFVGPIAAGLDVDHLCHNADADCPGGSTCVHRRCVNPAHLAPVTRSENMRRGKQQGRSNRCKNGHEYTADNTWISKQGWRYCKTCNAENQRRFRKKNRR